MKMSKKKRKNNGSSYYDFRVDDKEVLFLSQLNRSEAYES